MAENLEPWQQYLRDNEAAAEKRTRVDQRDGTVYEWNDRHRAWFPKVDEEFILRHNVEYGVSESGPEKSTFAEPQINNVRPNGPQSGAAENSKKGNKKKPQEIKNQPPEPEWFQVDPNNETHVYVSGMPNDVTEDEFIDMMAKFGIIMQDPETAKLKIKLYKDKDGNIKGDGLCCYLKHESVDLAIKILDETEMRGNTIHVECASFQLKGEYNPSLKVKRKKKPHGNNQEKLLDWVERDNYKKLAHKRACVIHYLFNPDDFINDPAAVLDYKEELKEEAEKFGEVKKVFVFERSKDGVASILFKDEEAAQKCMQKMDGRLCDGRLLSAHIWDGVTKYQEEETEEERELRLKRWHDMIDAEE